MEVLQFYFWLNIFNAVHILHEKDSFEENTFFKVYVFGGDTLYYYYLLL